METSSVIEGTISRRFLFRITIEQAGKLVSCRTRGGHGLVMRAPILPLVLILAVPVGRADSEAAARAWYDIGHRLVAGVAAVRLTPHTVQAVRDLLGGQDLADASLWADQIRGQRRDTGPLHFVNIPLDADTYVPERDCPGRQCIIAAIERD